MKATTVTFAVPITLAIVSVTAITMAQPFHRCVKSHWSFVGRDCPADPECPSPLPTCTRHNLDDYNCVLPGTNCSLVSGILAGTRWELPCNDSWNEVCVCPPESAGDPQSYVVGGLVCI